MPVLELLNSLENRRKSKQCENEHAKRERLVHARSPQAVSCVTKQCSLETDADELVAELDVGE